ncbi:hypothetical protein [Micromonospora echinofusca]|uniref:hypothetical protein n=1 Tax=Micromonospora echinofusca TaxID=47858 RepID=UPI00340B768A
MQQYLAVLDRQDWCTTIRSDFDPDSDAYFWFAGNVAMRLQLRAFTDPTVDR